MSVSTRKSGAPAEDIVQAGLNNSKPRKCSSCWGYEENLKELAAKSDPQWSDAQRRATLTELRQLLVERQQLLEKLSGGYDDRIRLRWTKPNAS